ncbi:MAG: chemotaxis protein CheD [bacterium]
METIFEIQMGEMAVGKGGDILAASGIGSCVAVTLYDAKCKIGALAHAMLPSRRLRDKPPDARYVDMAIDAMLEKMQAQGARKEDMEAKLVGGSNMFAAFEPNESIGKKNIASAKEGLKKHGIPVAGECVGGSQGRSVEFSIATGIVTVKTKF